MGRLSSAKPARSSRRRCASWPKSISAPAVLLRGLLQRRNAGQDDLDSGAAAGLGIKVEPAAQTVGHDRVDDMQAEPGAALVAAGGEKRIESTAAGGERHAPTISGKT